MREGTKSVLFGAHSPIHSIMVWRAWRKVYGAWPSWRVVVCIFLHDIGYWGMDYITNKSNAGHAQKGAKIAEKWFGCDFCRLIAGHSSYEVKRGYKESRLALPDDYSWLIAPIWWMSWNNWLEGFGVGPIEWRQAVRKKLSDNSSISGTELFHSLRKG